MIKAIETIYKGYRFRSRLEARWAVFFDAIGVQWEYEKQGLIMPNGKYYLPDFWLSSEQLFWEVKNENENLFAFYKQLGDIDNVIPLVLSAGPPWNYYTSDVGYLGLADEGWWSHCPKCNKVGFTYAGWAGYIKGCKCYDMKNSSYKFDGTKTDKIIKAIAAAKQARFEHGENGKPHA